MMSWRVSVVACTLALTVLGSACGFEPVYGEKSAHRETLMSVEFADPKTDAEFSFLKYVEQEMIRGSDVRYRIEYNVNVAESFRVENVGILRGTVDYRVIRLSDGELMFANVIRAVIDFRQQPGIENRLANTRDRERTSDILIRQLARNTYMELVGKFVSCGPSC